MGQIFKGWMSQAILDEETEELIVKSVGGGGNHSTLSFRQITGVHFHEASRLGNGHLSLGVDGAAPPERKAMSNLVIHFSRSMQPDFEHLHRRLEQLVQQNSQRGEIASPDIPVATRPPQVADSAPEPTLIPCAACARSISHQAMSCPNCGHPVTLSAATSSSSPSVLAGQALGGAQQPEGGPSSCPLCKQNDQVKRIATVVDVGSATTSGSATTVGVGTFGVGAGVSDFNARTSSDLATKFQVPKVSSPAKDAFLATVATLFVGAIVVAIFLPAGLLLPIVMVAVPIWVYRESARTVLLRRKLWQEAHASLRDGYFCFRDNVAFHAGDVTATDPSTFTKSVFSKYEKATKDA